MMGAFKSITTHRYTVAVRGEAWEPFEKRLWQRNYYEHVVHNHEELQRIRQYVLGNPRQWAFDSENPDATRMAGAEPWRM